MAFKYRERSAQALDKRATQQGGEFTGFVLDEFKTWNPKKGDNWVRILPPVNEDAQHYGIDVHVHYGVGPERASLVCLNKQFGQKCPICEARAVAERRGDEALAKDLKANKRVLVWMVDQKEPEKGPMLWAMPWTVDRDICKISKDRKTGEIYYIDHPEEGYDVFFDVEGEKMTKKYVGFSLARRPSSVDPRDLDFILKTPLEETLALRDYNEMQEIYEGGAGEGAGPGKAEDRGRRRDDDDTREPPRRGRADDRGDQDPPRRGREDEEERDPPPRRFADRRHPDAEDDRDPPRRSARDEDDRDPPRRSARDEDDRDPPRRGREEDDRDDRQQARRPDTRWQEEEPPFDPDPPRRRRQLPPADDEPPRRSREEEPPRRSSREEEEPAPRARRRLPEPEEEAPPRREEPRREEAPASAGKTKAQELRERFANRGR